MTKLARAVVPALPLVLLLAACAPASDDAAEPAPTLSLPVETSTPDPSPTGLPAGQAIEGWAAVALPEDRVDGPAPTVRASFPLPADEPATVPINVGGGGVYDLVLTCQSADGSDMSYLIESPTASIPEPRDLDCSAPGEPQPSTAIVAYEAVDASLILTTTADTVVAYELRLHVEPMQ